MPAVTSRRVALLSSGAYAHLDDDLPLLVAALAAEGIDGVVADWHDTSADWSQWDLVVLRSTWDYTSQLDHFVDTLEAIDAVTTLANPLPVVRANADKRYLLTLAEAGVPVVPTELFEPGHGVRLPEEVSFVVKPSVSAGARDTERYAAGEVEPALDHAEELLTAGRAVLVQPYVDGIDGAGETGLVFLGDRFSHAFRKGPILVPDSTFVAGLYRDEDITARTPSDEELEVADRVLAAAAHLVDGYDRSDLLYARVDLAPGPDGPLLMELELIEPSLFVPTAAGSADRFAAAVVQRLAS